MLLATREFVTAVTKLLSSGNFQRPKFDKDVPNSNNTVREMLKEGDALLQGGETQKALTKYEAIAENYASRGCLVQALSVYKRILQIDASCEDAARRIEELHQRLGVESLSESQIT